MGDMTFTSPLMQQLAAAVRVMERRGFNSSYIENGCYLLHFNPGCSKLDTLSNAGLNLTNSPPTYHLLGMPLPERQDGRQWWYGGGWALKRKTKDGGVEIVVVNTASVTPVTTSDVEIEALVETRAQLVGPLLLPGLQSLGKFPLDILHEVTSVAVCAAMAKKFPTLFLQPSV